MTMYFDRKEKTEITYEDLKKMVEKTMRYLIEKSEEEDDDTCDIMACLYDNTWSLFKKNSDMIPYLNPTYIDYLKDCFKDEKENWEKVYDSEIRCCEDIKQLNEDKKAELIKMSIGDFFENVSKKDYSRYRLIED